MLNQRSNQFVKMFRLELKALLFLAFFTAVNTSKDAKRPNKSIYYSPYQKTPPVLAKITPIDKKNYQIGETFSAYIYTNSKTPNKNPIYSVLCQKNNSNDNFAQINESLDEINKKLGNIIRFLNSRDSIQNQIKSSSKEEKENTEDFEHDEDDGFHSENSNSNVQSNIFQCDSVSCPENASKCRVLENSIEPNYEKILKTVLCLSSENKIVHKEEKEMMNPNKGSSLNTSKTYNRDNNHSNDMDSDFKKEMEKFQMSMQDTFG